MEPWIVKVTPLLRDLLPIKLYDRVSHLFGADTSMAHWTGRNGGSTAEARSKPTPKRADQTDTKH